MDGALPIKSFLKMEGLTSFVHLGCSHAEKELPQPIIIDITLGFTHDVPGCISDQIDDTVCYDELGQKILEFLDGKKFNLIESLTHQVYLEIKKSVDPEVRLLIKVTKTRAPVAFPLKQVTFSVGDWEP